MKINNVKNNIGFGLKIVRNNDLEKIYTYQLRHGKNYKEINEYFDRIRGLYGDNLYLSFSEYEEKKNEVFGNAPYCRMKIFGYMKKSDSDKVFRINRLSEYKSLISCQIYLINEIKAILNNEQKKIDSLG